MLGSWFSCAPEEIYSPRGEINARIREARQREMRLYDFEETRKIYGEGEEKRKGKKLRSPLTRVTFKFGFVESSLSC